jgi:hypothetical protein
MVTESFMPVPGVAGAGMPGVGDAAAGMAGAGDAGAGIAGAPLPAAGVLGMTGTFGLGAPTTGAGDAGAAGAPAAPVGNGVSLTPGSPQAASEQLASMQPNSFTALIAVMTSRVPEYLYGVERLARKFKSGNRGDR